jgi:hypothetical protein
MGAEPEVVTFIVRLVAEGGGRVAGIVERVRSGEKRRFRDIEETARSSPRCCEEMPRMERSPRLGGDRMRIQGCISRRAS